MAVKLYLFAWTDRLYHPAGHNHPAFYTGGRWDTWCAGVDGETQTYLGWIGESLVKAGWVKRKDWQHIGASAPKEPPAGANVSRVLSLFDNETPPDKPHPLP